MGAETNDAKGTDEVRTTMGDAVNKVFVVLVGPSTVKRTSLRYLGRRNGIEREREAFSKRRNGSLSQLFF